MARNAARVDNGITEGVIWKQLLIFFFPILLGTFFQQLYNTVDAVIVGKFVGKEALAAVGGATGTLINLLVGFFVGLASGATVIIAQYYGGRNEEDTSRAVHTAVALAIVGGLAIMVIGIGLSPFALRAMGTPEEIMEYALIYIRVYFGGVVFNLLYNIGSAILRAVGDSKRPLYFLIFCCLVNLVLDLVLVVGLHMGVFGVALGTLLSQAMSSVLVMLTLMRTTAMYRVVWKKVRFTGFMLHNIVRIGLPAGMQSVMYSVSNIIIQSSINSFGTNTMAAWTAYGKIDGLFWMIMSAFGTSIMTFAGQNFGAGKYDRIGKSVRVCLYMAFGTSIVLSVVLYFSGQYIFTLFTDDAAVLEEGVMILRLLVPYYFTYIWIEVLSGAIRGTGDAFMPMLLTCLGICVLRVVWIAVAVPLNRNILTVVFSYPVTWIVTSVLFWIYYKRGKWMDRRLLEVGKVRK